ncbi:MAG: hypothetical protein IJ370_00390 [Oscillospiraceae bacterium]|nr:hypothetical protein [Oscillospiraceae bacterium]
MAKTISALWNGNLHPAEDFGIYNSEIRELGDLIQRNLEKLEKFLDKNSKLLCEKYTDCVNEYICLCCEQAFSDGFCLGTKIITEALNSSDQIT